MQTSAVTTLRRAFVGAVGGLMIWLPQSAQAQTQTIFLNLGTPEFSGNTLWGGTSDAVTLQSEFDIEGRSKYDLNISFQSLCDQPSGDYRPVLTPSAASSASYGVLSGLEILKDGATVFSILEDSGTINFNQMSLSCEAGSTVLGMQNEALSQGCDTISTTLTIRTDGAVAISDVFLDHLGANGEIPAGSHSITIDSQTTMKGKPQPPGCN